MGDDANSGSYGAQVYLEFGQGSPRVGLQGYLESRQNSPFRPAWQTAAGFSYALQEGLRAFSVLQGSQRTPGSFSTIQARTETGNLLGPDPALNVQASYEHQLSQQNLQVGYGAHGEVRVSGQSDPLYQAQGHVKVDDIKNDRSLAVQAQIQGQPGEPARLDLSGQVRDAQFLGGPAHAEFQYQRVGEDNQALVVNAEANPVVANQPVQLAAYHRQKQQPNQPQQVLTHASFQLPHGQASVTRADEQWNLQSQGQLKLGKLHLQGELEADNQGMNVQGKVSPALKTLTAPPILRPVFQSARPLP